MAKQLEPTVFKHQQHLKLQMEADDELWISGEELRTDGSSDEENQKKFRAHKKVKVRRKSVEIKDKTSAASSRNFTEETARQSCKTEDDAADESVSWRPKRGSLKLPNLYEDIFDGKRIEFLMNENFYKETFNLHEYLPMLNPKELRDATTKYNEKLTAAIDSIDRLEERFIENLSQLEEEKRERLKIQEEMCSDINSDDHSHDKNAALFLQLCKYEENLNDPKGNDKCENDPTDINQEKKCPAVELPNGKNFIRRNVELAATAMSKLPITDEEKQQLERILSEPDVTKQQNTNGTNEKTINNVDNEEKINLENAFQLSENDKHRLNEIDLELENNFSETQNLKSSKNEGTCSFWKTLILDQTLKDIDEKLAGFTKDEEKLAAFKKDDDNLTSST